MKSQLVPAILVKSKKKLAQELKQVKKEVKTVQIDIMDGKFVKNKTIQPKDFEGIKSRLKYEMQLMVNNPEEYILPFKKIGAKLIIFHIEAAKTSKQASKLIKEIKKQKMKVGIGLNPETKPEKIKQFLKKIDLVLVMTVHPGKQGRKFMPSTLKKVEKIKKWDKKITIEVDGGINASNICKCVEAGANNIVVGSGIFKKKNVHKAIKELNKRSRAC